MLGQRAGEGCAPGGGGGVTDEERVQALVLYRFEQADDALLAARTLLAVGLARDSVNRS